MATLRELAEYTGFSMTTISRVLNDDPTMSASDATRAAILEAAGKLHYQGVPHRGKAPPSNALRFAVAEMLSPAEQLEDPYYLYLKNYAEQRCRDMGCRMAHLAEQGELYCPDSAGGIDGILAIGIFSGAQIDCLAGLSPNLVFLDSAPDELHYDSVVLNFSLGVKQAVDYLLARGHRRIGFLGPDRKLDQRKRPAPEVRRQCFIRCLESRGLMDSSLLLDSEMTAAAARTALSARLRSGEAVPTALLAANEEAAIGAVGAIREAGLRVPEDLSVISFNDTARSALTDPPLTSVNTHAQAMSAAAMELLVRRCAGGEFLPVKIVVPPTLTERESVCSV